MLKKVIYVVGGAALLAGLLFGRDAFSYVATLGSRIHASVRDRVPVKFDLERAKQSISDLDPEIRQNMKTIARQEIEVAQLQEKVRSHQDQLAATRSQVERLNNDLQTGNTVFVYAKERSYTEAEVRADLERRFKRLQSQQQTNDKLEKILQARQSALDAAKEKLEAMIAAKRQLEIDVAELEARQQLVEVHQTNSEINLDDSQLARTKELMDEIRTRVEVAEKLVDADSYEQYEIQIELDESESDITERVTRYLNGDHELEESLATAK